MMQICFANRSHALAVQERTDRMEQHAKDDTSSTKETDRNSPITSQLEALHQKL